MEPPETRPSTGKHCYNLVTGPQTIIAIIYCNFLQFCNFLEGRNILQLQMVIIVCVCLWPQVSTDGHTVHCLTRTSDSVLFQIHAHTDAISGNPTLCLEPDLYIALFLTLCVGSDMSLSCYIPGLLVTASTDDTIKFWDIQVHCTYT